MIRKNPLHKLFTKTAQFSFGAFLLGLYLSFPAKISAALRNPVIDEALGGDGTEASATAASDGSIFATYFVFLWQAFINVGGIAVIIYFMWGAFEWITAGGDSGKLTNARNKMVQAAIGLIILVSSFTILGFVSSLFFGDNFNLLELTFPTFSSTAGGTGTTTSTSVSPDAGVVVR